MGKELEDVHSERLIRKQVPIQLIRSSVEQGRENEIIICTETPDRIGDRMILAGADLEEFRQHPQIMWIHDYMGRTASAGLPVAKCPYIRIDGSKLVSGAPQFLENDPFADRVRNAWVQGFLTTASIGFDPLESQKNTFGGRDFLKWKLLEWSFAPIPMNPEAHRLAYKALGLEELLEKTLITKPEETEDYIRVPAPGEEGKHEGHRIRTIDLNEQEGIKALYCGEDKVIITYLFAKDKDWTMERAKEWVKEHSKKAIADEGIVLKYGAVLSRKNMEGLKEAQRLIQEVLDTAEKTEEAPKKQVTLSNIEMGRAIAEAVLEEMCKGEKQNA